MGLVIREAEFAAASADYFLPSYVNQDTYALPESRVATTEPRSTQFLGRQMSFVDKAPYFLCNRVNARDRYLRSWALDSLTLSEPLAFSCAAETFPATPFPTGNLSSWCKKDKRQIEQALLRLDQLSEKQDGWKGPESVSLTSDVRSAAEIFLRVYFSNEAMIQPVIGLDADGDLTFFWKTDAILMDLSITSDATYSFYARLADCSTFESDEMPVEEPLPTRVIAALIADPA